MIAYKLQRMIISRLLKKSLYSVLLIFFVLFFSSCSYIMGRNQTAAKNHYQEGINQLKRGQKEQAIRSFRTAITKNKKYAQAYFELAQIYLEENSINARVQADWALRNAVRYHPENIAFRLALAKLYLAREFYHTAEKEFKQIIKRDSSLAEAWFSLGFIHEREMLRLQNLITPDSSGETIYFTGFAKEELEKTLFFYKKSIEVNPTYLPAYYRIGFVFYESEDWQNMISIFRQTLKYSPEDKNGHLYLALAYYRSHQFELAFKEYQTAWEKMDKNEQNFYFSVEPLLSTKAGKTFLAKTENEKKQYTTSFWQSKDPMFLTDFNERLMEHFSRIAYANLRFSFPQKNIMGWQTDRGKVYIRFGPPNKQSRTTASFKETNPGDRYPLKSSKETWDYPDFKFVFEDRFLNKNYQFKWGVNADDDYLNIYNRTIKTTPDFYRPDFGGKIFDLPVIIRQFDTLDSLKTIYIFSGIPVEYVDRRNYTGQNRIEADLQKGLFVFNEFWHPVFKIKKDVTLQFSQTYKLQDNFFLSVDSLKLPSANYNFAIEFFDPQGKNLVKYQDSLKVIDWEKGGLGLSDIILARDIRLKTSITQISRTKIGVTPDFDFSFFPGQALFLYYEIYNLKKNVAKRTKYRISHIIRRLDSKNTLISDLLTGLKLQKKALPEITATFNYEGDKINENLYRIIRLKDYQPGDYELTIRVEDLNNSQATQRSVVFHIQR